MTTTKKSLEAEVISIFTHDRFSEVLNTIPIIPEHSNLVFDSHGIVFHESADSSANDAYIEKCARLNVIPFTLAELGYVSNLDCFKVGSFMSGQQSFTPKQMAAIRGMQVKGGKINRCSVDIKKSEFEKFRTGIWHELNEQHYKLTKGTLDIDYGIPNWGGDSLEPDTQIIFDYEQSKIILVLGQQTNPQDIEKLSNWFEQLKERYLSR